MNAHKRALLRHLLASTPIKGVIDNWSKANGYIRFNIEGTLNGERIGTSSVVYDLVDESNGRRFVVTSSTSFYELGTSAWSDPISLAREKNINKRFFCEILAE